MVQNVRGQKKTCQPAPVSVTREPERGRTGQVSWRLNTPHNPCPRYTGSVTRTRFFQPITHNVERFLQLREEEPRVGGIARGDASSARTRGHWRRARAAHLCAACLCCVRASRRRRRRCSRPGWGDARGAAAPRCCWPSPAGVAPPRWTPSAGAAPMRSRWMNQVHTQLSAAARCAYAYARPRWSIEASQL